MQLQRKCDTLLLSAGTKCDKNPLRRAGGKTRFCCKAVAFRAQIIFLEVNSRTSKLRLTTFYQDWFCSCRQLMKVTFCMAMVSRSEFDFFHSVNLGETNIICSSLYWHDFFALNSSEFQPLLILVHWIPASRANYGLCDTESAFIAPHINSARICRLMKFSKQSSATIYTNQNFCFCSAWWWYKNGWKTLEICVVYDAAVCRAVAQLCVAPTSHHTHQTRHTQKLEAIR